MILDHKLKKEEVRALKLQEGEKVRYCTPYDISDDGSFITDSYVVVTDRRIIVLSKAECRQSIDIADITDVQSEADISCGLLMYTMGDENRLLVRYSSKHLSRYSYIARGIRLIIAGKDTTVESKEPEKTCPNCGRALPGTNECPHCSHKGRGLVHELRIMLKPYWLRMVIIITLMLTATLVTMLNPSIQKYLIDDVLKSEEGTVRMALLAVAGMFVLNVAIVFVNAAKSYMCAKLGTYISTDLRRRMYHKIQTMSLSFINEKRPGELMNRIVYDALRVQEFMANVFCNMFTVVILFVVDAVVMIILDPFLALVGFAFVPAAAILSFAFRKKIRRVFRLQWRKSDKIESSLQDVISGMAVVKSYGKEADESERFSDYVEQFRLVSRRNEIFWALFFPAVNFLFNLGTFLVIYFGGVSVLGGTKTAGELMQFVSYTTMLYAYIDWLTNLPRLLMNMVTSVERINDILNQEPTIYDHPGAVKHRIKGDVVFEDASFGYKSYKPVLEHVDLHIEPGEMIGLVGASGTGKSTLINLIMHLYEVDDGRLLIDGMDIKDIELADYHSQIGVVLQETFLFSGTILNNIKFAKPDATIDEVIMAAKMANAHDFICHTPDGYNTYVGEKGYGLSGGERQRIAIARAILNDPRILILDEATASLDTESEYLIQKALERLTSGRTTFAIAHRLSTLKDADRLVVIDDHHVAEVGTHNELMAKKGIYYGLVTAQLEMNKAAVAE